MCITLIKNFSKVAENIAQLYRDDRKKNIFCTSGQAYFGKSPKFSRFLIMKAPLMQLFITPPLSLHVYLVNAPHNLSPLQTGQ